MQTSCLLIRTRHVAHIAYFVGAVPGSVSPVQVPISPFSSTTLIGDGRASATLRTTDLAPKAADVLLKCLD